MKNNAQKPPPMMIRADAAARLMGITPDAFKASCKAGQLPLELIPIGGKRITYVRTVDFCTFMRKSADELLTN